MSYLRNPSFENSTSFWKPINHASDVTFSVSPSSNPSPVTGTNIADMVSLVSGGSIGQDVLNLTAPSVSSFAYVASVTGSDGNFVIWNLTTGVNSETPFTTQGTTWQLVMNTLDIGGTADVRVEIYLNTPGGQLSIDYVNLF